jgi:hypothetical protein
MGGDGGSIPGRQDLVYTKKRGEQKDKDFHRIYKWQHCAIKQEPLKRPIVSCELGKLYNKESILQMLIDKGEKPTNAAHIRNLKDVKELDLTDNPSFKGKDPSVTDGKYEDVQGSPWICPLTGLEMNGRFNFVFDWTNGKVISDRAYVMMKDDEASRILEENVVIINPDEGDESDRMLSKMDGRRARAKLEKKAAKDAKRKMAAEVKTEDELVNGDGKAAAAAANEAENGAIKKTKLQKRGGGGGEKSASSSAPSSSSSSSRGRDKLAKANLPEHKSIQDDPNRSEVFKALFDTHKSAQNKPKNHWVTFDPRYHMGN